MDVDALNNLLAQAKARMENSEALLRKYDLSDRIKQ